MISANGITPWHKLGQVFPGVPSLDEAREAAFNWEPVSVPLYGPTGQQVPGTVGVARVGPGEDPEAAPIIATVGTQRGKHHLTNTEAMEWYRPLVDSGLVTIETAGSLHGGKRVWILGKVQQGADLVIGGDDKIERYVLLAHGHDGEMSIFAGLNPVRVVCANTLAWSMSGNNAKGMIRARHSSKHGERLAALQAAIIEQNAELETTVEAYKELAKRRVTPAQVTTFAAAVFGEVERKAQEAGKVSRRLAKLVELFETGVGQDMETAKGTWWGLYNALTEYQTHYAGAERSRVESVTYGDGNARLSKGLDAALTISGGGGIPVDDVLDVIRERATS